MPTGASAQQFLAIDTIRENVVVLKDGSYRVVLMCSTLNFALKSTDEQDAIIYQYQNFINSLDFSLQFVIHSRKFNIGPYLETLSKRHKEEHDELLKIQIAEYIEFVKTFVESSNIMSKMFYTVVSFTPPSLETKKGILGNISSALGLGGSGQTDKDKSDFESHKNQLWQRVDAVAEGIKQFGIRSVPLNTEELIELFYGLYNPTEFEKTTSIPAE
ncbi:MAG: hypothetical protein Q8Q89_01745 [bacterium]|nr:hypothetical protein [bacterium]